MTIREILKEINNIPEASRNDFARFKYLDSFPSDFIEHFLVYHCSQYDYPIFRYFDFFDMDKCSLETCYVNSVEIFSLIDYAPTCNLRDESLEAFKELEKIKNFWPFGTWSAPTIGIFVNEKILLIDGNNRLRMLRMFLSHSRSEKASKHKIYLLKTT